MFSGGGGGGGFGGTGGGGFGSPSRYGQSSGGGFGGAAGGFGGAAGGFGGQQASNSFGSPSTTGGFGSQSSAYGSGQSPGGSSFGGGGLGSSFGQTGNRGFGSQSSFGGGAGGFGTGTSGFGTGGSASGFGGGAGGFGSGGTASGFGTGGTTSGFGTAGGYDDYSRRGSGGSSFGGGAGLGGASSFGSPGFGGQSGGFGTTTGTSSFGSPSTFGSGNSAFGGNVGGSSFGATNTSPYGGGGGFGSTNTGFGGSSTFGGTTAGGMGGTTSYGSTTGGLYGSSASNTSGGLFGSNQNRSGAFGSPSYGSGGYGSSTPGGLGSTGFGTTGQGFGNTGTTGTFGSNTGTGFGSNTTGGIYGSGQTGAGTSLYGASAPGTTGFGSTSYGSGTGSTFGNSSSFGTGTGLGATGTTFGGQQSGGLYGSTGSTLGGGFGSGNTGFGGTNTFGNMGSTLGGSGYGSGGTFGTSGGLGSTGLGAGIGTSLGTGFGNTTGSSFGPSSLGSGMLGGGGSFGTNTTGSGFGTPGGIGIGGRTGSSLTGPSYGGGVGAGGFGSIGGSPLGGGIGTGTGFQPGFGSSPTLGQGAMGSGLGQFGTGLGTGMGVGGIGATGTGGMGMGFNNMQGNYGSPLGHPQSHVGGLGDPSPLGSLPPPLFPNRSQFSSPVITPLSSNKPVSSHYKATPRSSIKVKPRGFGTPTSSTPSKYSIFEDKPTQLTKLFVPRRSIKKLVVLPDDSLPSTEPSEDGETITSPRPKVMTGPISTIPTPRKGILDSATLEAIKQDSTNAALDENQHPDLATSFPTTTSSQLPTLSLPGYTLEPSLQDLAKMSTEELSSIKGFTISRKHFGAVHFLEEVDVRGLDLDSLVEITHGEIVMYPDESLKPEIGEGLNKSAKVILEGIKYKNDPGGKKMDTVLRKKAAEQGATHISYDVDHSAWVFVVQHWSRYGIHFEDESSESDEPSVESTGDAGETFSDYSGSGHQSEGPPFDNQASAFPSFDISPLRNEPLEEADNSSLSPSESDFMAEEEFAISSLSKPAPRLPERLGLDPQKMHLMKASCFDTSQRERKSSEFLLGSESGSDSSEEAFLPKRRRTDLQYEGMEDEVNAPDPPCFRSDAHLIPSSNHDIRSTLPLQQIPFSFPRQFQGDSISIVQMTQKWTSAGSGLGTSFRVGWGSGGLLFCPSSSQTSSSTFSIKICRLVGTDPNDPLESVQLSHLSLLEAHQATSRFPFNAPFDDDDQDEDDQQMSDIPSNLITDALATASARQAALRVTSFLGSPHSPMLTTHSESVLKHIGRVLQQVCALWTESSSLDDWLRDMCISLTDSLRQKQSDFHSPSESQLRDAFFSLCSGNIADACSSLWSNGDRVLGSLIGQIGTHRIQEMAKKQLHLWDSLKSDENQEIPLETPTTTMMGYYKEALWRLVGGDTCEAVLAFRKGEKCPEFNWLVYFALHKWYSRGTINNYQRIVESEQAPPPLTFYSSQAYDSIYHLLKLDSDSTYPLSRVLDPSASSPYPLDFRLSWHLFSTLKALKRVPKFEKIVDLTLSYVCQLEACDLWDWGVYVLSHLPNEFSGIRDALIKDLISRHCHQLGSRAYHFLTDELHVPKKWINEAMAWYLGYVGDYHNQLQAFLDSKQWEAAHQLVVEQLAPEYIYTKRPRLRHILQELQQNSRHLSGWVYRGKVFSDYLKLCLEHSKWFQDFQEASKSSSNASYEQLRGRMQQMGEDAVALARRLPPLVEASKSPTHYHVCLAQMSSKIVDIFFEVFQWLKPTDSNPLSQEGPSVLFSLPLTADKRLAAISHLSDYCFQQKKRL